MARRCRSSSWTPRDLDEIDPTAIARASPQGALVLDPGARRQAYNHPAPALFRRSASLRSPPPSSQTAPLAPGPPPIESPGTPPEIAASFKAILWEPRPSPSGIDAGIPRCRASHRTLFVIGHCQGPFSSYALTPSASPRSRSARETAECSLVRVVQHHGAPRVRRAGFTGSGGDARIAGPPGRAARRRPRGRSRCRLRCGR